MPPKIPLTKEQALTIYEGIAEARAHIANVTDVVIAAYTATSPLGVLAERASLLFCNEFASQVRRYCDAGLTSEERHTHPRILAADAPRPNPFPIPQRTPRAPRKLPLETHLQMGNALKEVKGWMTRTFVLLSKSYRQDDPLFRLWRRTERAVGELRSQLDNVVCGEDHENPTKIYYGERTSPDTIPLAS